MHQDYLQLIARASFTISVAVESINFARRATTLDLSKYYRTSTAFVGFKYAKSSA